MATEQAATPSTSRQEYERDALIDEQDERQGLLSGSTSRSVEQLAPVQLQESPQTSRRRTLFFSVLGVVLIALGVAFSTKDSSPPPSPRPPKGRLLSNGTHDFRRTVLIVSLDGLQAGYLGRGFTPHLLDISHKGLRAEYIKPIFPTITFPNHWALMTGLYAESHGIVANNFWDPAQNAEFVFTEASSSWDASWWLGEPVCPNILNRCQSSENSCGTDVGDCVASGLEDGKFDVVRLDTYVSKPNLSLLRPGPPKTSKGNKPTYFVPFKNHVPLQEKLDQLLAWIDLPLDERPQLITAYEPSVDQAGHKAGPRSQLVNDTLAAVDVFARNLHEALDARNLSQVVDVIFVSDHGMTDTSAPTFVYIDDIIGKQGVEDIEHEDGWPSMGLRFRTGVDETAHFARLEEYSKNHPGQYEIYTHETMPARWHFSGHERIAPIYVVPKIGYALTVHGEGDVSYSKGNHGFDNEEPSMRAMFVAHGPFAHEAKALARRDRWRTADDNNRVFVMPGFNNLEIYGLVTRLLDIEDWSAPHNGTAGFWDDYVD